MSRYYVSVKFTVDPEPANQWKNEIVTSLATMFSNQALYSVVAKT